MRRFLIVLTIISFLVAGVYGPGSTSISASGNPDAVAAKKHCKTVKKHGHKKRVCTTTRKPAPAPTSTPTDMPTSTPTSTPMPTATSTSTPAPTATLTNTPIPTATLPPFTIQTGLGLLHISDVQFTDRWPPSCSGVNCIILGPANELVAISLAKPDGSSFSIPEDLQVLGESSTAHLISADGSDSGPPPGAGLWSGQVHVAFEVPVGAHGFKLYWPGNPPVDLGK